MTGPKLAPTDQDNIDTVKARHKFAPAQIGDEDVLEDQPSRWRTRLWRGLLRFVVFCGLVFVIAYLATLLRDSAP